MELFLEFLSLFTEFEFAGTVRGRARSGDTNVGYGPVSVGYGPVSVGYGPVS